MPEERLLDRAGGILGGGTNLVPTSGGSNHPGRPNSQLSHQHVAGDRRGWLGDSKARGAVDVAAVQLVVPPGPAARPQAAIKAIGSIRYGSGSFWSSRRKASRQSASPLRSSDQPAVRRHVVSISVEDLDRQVVAGKPPSVAEADAARRVEVWAAVVRVESPDRRPGSVVPLHGQELLGPVDPEQDRLRPNSVARLAPPWKRRQSPSLPPSRSARSSPNRREQRDSVLDPSVAPDKPPSQRSVRTRRPERTVDERPRRGRRLGRRATHKQADGNSAPEEQNAAEQGPRFRPAHSGKPTHRTPTRFAQQRRLPPQRHRKNGPCKRALRLFGRTPPIP